MKKLLQCLFGSGSEPTPTKQPAAKSVSEHIMDALKSRDLHYMVDSTGYIMVGMKTENGALDCYYMVDEENSMFVIRVDSPFTVPPDKQDKVFGMIHDMNRRMLFGKLFMTDAGNIRMSYACNVDDGAINDKIILSPLGALCKTLPEKAREIMMAASA